MSLLLCAAPVCWNVGRNAEGFGCTPCTRCQTSLGGWQQGPETCYHGRRLPVPDALQVLGLGTRLLVLSTPIFSQMNLIFRNIYCGNIEGFFPFQMNLWVLMSRLISQAGTRLSVQRTTCLVAWTPSAPCLWRSHWMEGDLFSYYYLFFLFIFRQWHLSLWQKFLLSMPEVCGSELLQSFPLLLY